MKRIVSSMIALLTTVNLCACSASNGGDTSQTTASSSSSTISTAITVSTEEITPLPEKNYETATYDLPAHADHFKVIGRSKELSNGITMDWSGSGIEFNADCTGAITVIIQASKEGKLLCIVDGVASTSYITVESGRANYTIATDLVAGPHTVRLIKVTAIESGQPILMSVRSVTLTGTLGDRPEDKPYFVEFIGDSITCGFGAFSKEDSGTYANLSFGYLLAERLGWDYSFVSISGIGSYKSSERHNGLRIGDVYPYISYYRSTTELYQPKRQADLVVITLNTNDNARVTAEDRDAYRERVSSLIDNVHALHGEDTNILWLSFNNRLCDEWVQEILEELGGNAQGYYYARATIDANGGGSHPSASSHISVAGRLETELRQYGLWGLS